MPWFNMKELSDAHLKAIWAYLRSIQPVKNQVPFPISPAASANAGPKLKSQLTISKHGDRIEAGDIRQ
jgi:hypothetical protein